jgi:hypothetical protein
MKLKKFLEAVMYKINEGFVYQWNCFGSNAFSVGIERSKKNQFIYSSNCIFDTKTQDLYEITFWDYRKKKVFRSIKNSYLKKYKSECKKRNVSFSHAYDRVNYTDVSFKDIILIIKKALK